MKRPNIWSQHKEALQKLDNLKLRRIIQKYIIREITREDLIVEKFISAKYKDEDETWIEAINKIYAEEAIFNKTFKPETLKDRVDRWLKAIVEKHETIKVCESSEEEIGRVDRIGSKNSRERDTAQENGLLPLLEIYRPFIKGTRDERMHGGSAGNGVLFLEFLRKCKRRQIKSRIGSSS